MKYSIKVNEVRAKDGSNIKGFATVVFGDSFKITNIAILENKENGELFVSMPRYRSNERDESNIVRNSIPIYLRFMPKSGSRRKQKRRHRKKLRKCRSFP